MAPYGSIEAQGELSDDDSLPVEFHTPSETYRTEFDFVTQTASDAVVSAVASVHGCDPLELPPLFQSVDPDALDSVFARREGSLPGTDATLTFEYADHAVTVNSYGTVRIESPEVVTL